MKKYIRITYLFLLILLIFLVLNNKNRLIENINYEVNNFNIHFNKKIKILEQEIEYISLLKKEIKMPEIQQKNNMIYFNSDQGGVYLKNIDNISNTYTYIPLNYLKNRIKATISTEIIGIAHAEFKSLEDYEQIIYTDIFNEKWVDILSNKSLSYKFFQTNRSFSGENKEFVLYGLYTDKVYKKEMISIGFPIYSIHNTQILLQGIWYFDFNKEFFRNDISKFKERLNLNALIIDGNENIIVSTDKNITNIKDYGNYYIFPFGKTDYTLLIKKENYSQLFGLKEILLILIIIISIIYIFKQEKLEKEIFILKRQIESYLIFKDPLSKLYNRYFIDSKLQFPLEKCSIILIDIDNFKTINDTYGHHTGDLVIKGFSNSIRLILQKNDYGIRWGGEEFLLIFSNKEKEFVLKKLELLQKLIYNLNIINNYSITASFGGVYEDFISMNALYSIISRADDNLYLAKAQGKNKVIF